MTIRFLCDYGPFPIGAIATFGPTAESAFVAQSLADYNLDGGFPYEGPPAMGQIIDEPDAAIPDLDHKPT